MPVIPSWLLEPLWEQFSALLPDRPVYHPGHPLGCHRPRVSDRVVFEKLLQLLRFGCSYQAIADSRCSATTIRARRDEWIAAGTFARLAEIARDAYDRIAGLELGDLAVDGCITKAPGGGQCAGRSPVDRGKQGMKRSVMTDARGIPLGRVLAPANRQDPGLLPATLDKLAALGPRPAQITVHLDAAYDTAPVRAALAERAMTGEIARKRALPAPIQATRRWHVERTNAWHNSFNRIQRCSERREAVIDAYFDLADAVIITRRLIRQAWATHRWDNRPARRP